MPREVDELFEFDAPKFRDLSVPILPLPEGKHDPWFDEIHEDHSKPSVELARDFAEAVRRLEGKKDPPKGGVKSNARLEHKTARSGRDKENQPRKVLFTKQYGSVKAWRKPLEPVQATKDLQTESRAPKRRQPLVDAGNRLNAERKRKASREEKTIRELLKKHNKKIKTAHAYEPSRHSVREVKQWEREMKKSYYALSVEERVRANQEITLWKKQRLDSKQKSRSGPTTLERDRLSTRALRG
ncbi:hypothetical protein PsorP6_006574 [Peronosclerospora sorghi]|uniref:Uncharacterized protein n=1 Tax=Peronosclerospora sorghi TaxID=230839 RepID=A0ACC0W3D8_9STRA|nr:hypothetical protein PsorP6_006574 [Peronosclerospora sorghi]